jgi:hypothetical protein
MRGREPFVVWLLFGIVAVEILVTYWRLPAEELYHVSGGGLAGGASRALVFMNFPAALAAIAVVALVFERLRSRALRALALAAVLVCTPVFWPGVVTPADLDARWVNAPAGVGVVLALALTFAAASPESRVSLRRDRLCIGLAGLALLAAPPWLAAEAGFFLDGVPVLGRLYATGPSFVHHGHHHGMDGVLLVWSALLLSRALPSIRARALRLATGVYLALMLVYGIGNIVNDFWLEQVVKRGWTTVEIPSVLEPRLTWAWAVIVAATAVVVLAWLRSEPSRAAIARA